MQDKTMYRTNQVNCVFLVVYNRIRCSFPCILDILPLAVFGVRNKVLEGSIFGDTDKGASTSLDHHCGTLCR